MLWPTITSRVAAPEGVLRSSSVAEWMAEKAASATTRRRTLGSRTLGAKFIS